MFWNGRRNATSDGSLPALARSGKNGAIQICGCVPATRRTPNVRLLDTVTQYISSLFAPSDCANGAHRPHEFVRFATDEFSFASWIGGELPWALTTHSVALALLYAPLFVSSLDWL